MESSIFDCVRTLKNIDVAQVDAKQLTQNDFKNNYVDKNLPCLIKNAISNWPAVSKWTDSAYLIDQCSDYKVNCYPHMNYIEDENIQNGMELVRFEDAVSKLNETTKEVFSVPSVVIDDSRNFSELKKDIGEFAFLKNPARPLGYPSKRFFLYKGAATGWHYHHSDETLMCQVIGTKRVGLFPSNHTTHKILKEAFKFDDYIGNPDKLKPFANILKESIVVDVEPHDALYIPPFWWHGVEPIDSNIGLTLACCWRSPFHKISDFSYPPVKELWRAAFKRPSKLTLMVPPLYSLSAVARIFRKFAL